MHPRISFLDTEEGFSNDSKKSSTGISPFYLAFDTTTISSYSQLIKQAKYGKNKEHDSLAQLNLALLYGEESRLPVYYRKLAGNITDVKTVQNLLKDIAFLQTAKVSLVMDRGFYSEANINGLFKNHHKFLIGVKKSLEFIHRKLDEIRGDFITRANYDSKTGLYIMTFTMDWEYTETKPRKENASAANAGSMSTFITMTSRLLMIKLDLIIYLILWKKNLYWDTAIRNMKSSMRSIMP